MEGQGHEHKHNGGHGGHWGWSKSEGVNSHHSWVDTRDVYPRAFVGEPAPYFEAPAYQQKDFKEIKLSDYKGKWVCLFFYPLDFTFVCPTEILAFADANDQFAKLHLDRSLL